MLKKVFIAGVLGEIVLIVWAFVVNGILGFQASIDMKQIDTQSQVYEVLNVHIVAPGRYVLNPELTQEGIFPAEEPVYSVLYSGIGHESAGRLMLIRLLISFLSVIIAAWLLSQASDRILSNYLRRVLFFMAIGLLMAILNDLTKYNIGGYPLKDAMLLALNQIISWTLVGLVVAWKMKPIQSLTDVQI